MIDIRNSRVEQTIVLKSEKVHRTGAPRSRRGIKAYPFVVLTWIALCGSALSHAAMAEVTGPPTARNATSSTTLTTATASPSNVESPVIGQRNAPTQSNASAASASQKNDLASRVGSYGDLSADAPCH